MSLEDIRDYCLSLPYAEETLPFDDTTIVYKVGGRWFAVVDVDDGRHVVVKADPDVAIELRDLYPEITEAWHFNKRHWNSIRLDGDLAPSMILEQVFNSYRLVIKKNVTPKAYRMEIEAAVMAYLSER